MKQHRTISSTLSTHKFFEYKFWGGYGGCSKNPHALHAHKPQPINVEFSCTEEILESVWMCGTVPCTASCKVLSRIWSFRSGPETGKIPGGITSSEKYIHIQKWASISPFPNKKLK